MILCITCYSCDDPYKDTVFKVYDVQPAATYLQNRPDFTEVNGSDATANAISRETGCQVAQLTMLMDGPEEGDLSTYLEGVRSNVNTIVSFFGGEELDQL